MTVGCYVIGGTVIHLNQCIRTKRKSYKPIDGCVQYFAAACKNLRKRLECLVIVEPDVTDPKILKEIFEVAQKYANSVYIIPAVVAILQYSVSEIKHFNFDQILMFFRIPKSVYYACCLTKDNSLIYPFCVKAETDESLKRDLYSGFPFKDVYCIHQYYMGKNAKRLLTLQFPTIKFFHLKPSLLTALAIGGFFKAQCIVEHLKYIEVLNFAPGIYNGNIEIVNRCSRFPLELNYTPMVGVPTCYRDILTVQAKTNQWKIRESEIILPPQTFAKNYLIGYNKFGLLALKDLPMTKPQLSFSVFDDFLLQFNKVHVWSIEKQVRVAFDFVQQKRYFDPFDDYVNNLFSVEWLNNLGQSTEEFPTPASDLHTVLIEKNIYNYINGPLISITPSYIGMLQYYVAHFKPTTQNLIIIVSTKNCSKFYALNQRSPFCYHVTYISDYSENRNLFDLNFAKKGAQVLYLYEKGMNPTLTDNPFINFVTAFEISDIEDVMYFGGAIYALHNSNSILISPYVTFDPLFDPEKNCCDGFSTVSQKTSTYFYEIDAFFHGALKSINTNLFYGDLIAIIVQINKQVYIYFFCHIESKFLFKFDITVMSSTIIDADLLHFADYVVAENIVDQNLQMLKIAKNVSVNFLQRDKTSGINEFLKDMMDEKLLIYDTLNYSEVIIKARRNCILENVIFEKTIMTIECKSDKCRIVFEDDYCIVVDGEEWIPMYISFLQADTKIGKEAIKDLETSPESVIYDFIKLIGLTSKTLTNMDPKWKFQIIEIDESDDPKIGFKAKTTDGYKIILPDMAMRIYLQNLIKIFEKYIGKDVNMIKIRLLDSVLTTCQKNVFQSIAKRLNIILVIC